MTVLLEVEGLDVCYDSPSGLLPAVSGVSFTLARGEVLGIAGESGSGKSTLINALLRLQRPPAITTGGRAVLHTDDGPVELLGADAATLRGLRWTTMAVVFQSAMNALNPVHRLVSQFSDAIRQHTSMTRPQARARAAEVLALVGIPASRLDAYPHELSGGMRQRAMIALALVCEPDLVVMDEPTTAVDVVMQRQILRQITALQRELGFAIVFITHDLSLLIELADRIAVMYGGRFVETGPSRELYTDPRHPYTAGLRDSFPPLHGPRRVLTGIPGNPPDLRALPPGCSFAPRCPRSTVECTEERPATLVVGTREVACHHPLDPAASTPTVKETARG